MNAVIDPRSAPNVVVIMTDDDQLALDVATRYAQEVGYPVLILTGDATEVAPDGSAAESIVHRPTIKRLRLGA